MPDFKSYFYDFTDKLININLSRTDKSLTIIKLKGLNIYMNTDKKGYRVEVGYFKNVLCYKLIYSEAPNDVFISLITEDINKLNIITINDDELKFNDKVYYLIQDDNKLRFVRNEELERFNKNTETFIKIIALNNFN